MALLLSFFWQRNYYKYILLATFSVGVFGFVSFTALEITVGLTIGELHLGLNPVVLLFGLLVYLFNYQEINNKLLALIKPSNSKIAQDYLETIAEFKERFAQKSSEDLKQIVESNKLVPAALAAAKQLLQERQIIQD